MWLAVSSWLLVLIMLVIVCYAIAKIIFVAQYGEQIRQSIISMPEYKPSWFAIVGLDKPIRPWQLVRVNFFVIRLFGVVLGKKTSSVNECFKDSLPKEAITYLKVLRIMLRGGGMLLLLYIILFFLFSNN